MTDVRGPPTVSAPASAMLFLRPASSFTDVLCLAAVNGIAEASGLKVTVAFCSRAEVSGDHELWSYRSVLFYTSTGGFKETVEREAPAIAERFIAAAEIGGPVWDELRERWARLSSQLTDGSAGQADASEFYRDLWDAVLASLRK